MCGIYGITTNDKIKINRMIEICSYRGPDGQNVISENGMTLGHNLLSITSEPKDGKQPWVSENNNMLVFNGEIFNYSELLKKFHNKFRPKTSCDTELLSWLLNNYDYQKVISENIDSMHALAFYNSHKKELLLSRDHVGIKPLYFSLGSFGLIFASEIKPLTEFVYNSKKINQLALGCTSLLGVNPLRETLFTGIYKVMPGESLVFNLINKKITHSFNTFIRPTSKYVFNKEEFIFQTERAISNSTLGNRKFGIFLSGGIDSSLVAFELNKKINKLSSFTNLMKPNEIINGEDHNSDALIAKRFSTDFNFEHKEIIITPEIIMKHFDDSIKFIEEPVYSWNLPMYYYTNKILSQNGITVTMAGDVGDEIFGGYSKYFFFKNLKNKPKTWKEFLIIWMKKFAAPMKLNLNFGYNELLEVLMKSLPDSLWNPEDVANSAMALDCITTVSEDFFKRNDRYGMAFSMEGRFPLSSKQFMQFCMDIHSDFKFGKTASENKLPVRIAYKNEIPNYIFSKNKTGWSVPITVWLETQKDLKNKFIEETSVDDGISPIISNSNFQNDHLMDKSVNNKRAIIAWMFKNWSKCYDMHL